MPESGICVLLPGRIGCRLTAAAAVVVCNAVAAAATATAVVVVIEEGDEDDKDDDPGDAVVSTEVHLRFPPFGR